MSAKHLLLGGWLLLLLSVSVSGQSLDIVAETEDFIDYQWNNDELRIFPPHSFFVPVRNGTPEFQILSQSVSRVPELDVNNDAMKVWLASDSVGVIEMLGTGSYRNSEIAEIHMHRARSSDTGMLITRKLKVRIYKSKPGSPASARSILPDHPLASGNWYKIPFREEGIYELDTDYLRELGLDVSNLDPRNLQLWGTNGYPLAELNSAPRSVFSQIPVTVTGESDGSFDANDRLLFYGNSPHQVILQNGEYEHRLHPYSNDNFVFLTVGQEPGIRIADAAPAPNPVAVINDYQDFIWMDQEIRKPEDKFRSGRFWLGQSIGADESGTNVSVFRDTLTNLMTGSLVRVEASLYGRSEQTISYTASLNGTQLSSQNISPLTFGYNSSEGAAANPSGFNSSITTDLSGGVLNLTINANLTQSASQLFVDWIRLVVTRGLIAEEGMLSFHTPSSSAAEESAQYELSGFENPPTVWDVSQPENPVQLPVTLSNGLYQLNYTRNSGKHIIAQTSFLSPEPGIMVPPQNLSGNTSYPDYIIVTSEALKPEAEELATYRASQGLTPLVVTQRQVFNEFSGGVTDPVAIRDFVKHLWDTATTAGERLPEYLLFFGDTSYDTKSIAVTSLTNHVVTYQSIESVNRVQTFGTDDFFTYMDDAEGDFSNGTTPNSFMMDLSVGRIPVQTSSEASAFIDKIRTYEDPQYAGEWQNLFTYVADDDFPNPNINRDLHTLNADVSAEIMQINEPGIRLKKIYEFSYPVEITGAGRQVPEATRDLIETVNNGTLVLNYSGHGNEQVLSDEELFISDYIPDFTNQNRYCVLITATCQFGRFDDSNEQSGAEKFVLAQNGGAIAALTTTRVVYTSSIISNNNFGLNVVLSQRLSERQPGQQKRLGDIFMQTKNSTIPGSTARVGASLNNKKFVLLGDPATLFQLPEKSALVRSINSVDVQSQDTTLTIRALDQLNITGEVILPDSSIDASFDGEVTLRIYDAERPVTLPDRGWSCSLTDCQYSVEQDLLFKGRVAVTNGTFNANLVIPKDISSSTENGRFVVYANGSSGTAGGSFPKVIFDGINPNAPNDVTGPSMDVYLNDQSFVNGNLVNNSPTLVVELDDETGINTTGTGVGHEITATINTQPEKTIILNNFYEGNLNDFTAGKVEYPLDQLPEGQYSLKVRAWDVLNNPTEKEIFFEVGAANALSVRNIYNYPNPMNNRTQFTFEHNQPGIPLDVSIRIYTLSGRPVQHLRESVQSTGSYVSIPWNGRDRDQDRVANGTYIYVLRVSADTPEGRQSIEKTEKLVIIR